MAPLLTPQHTPSSETLMHMPTRIALRLASGLAGTLLATAALAQVTFYENDDCGGRRPCGPWV